MRSPKLVRRTALALAAGESGSDDEAHALETHH